MKLGKIDLELIVLVLMGKKHLCTSWDFPANRLGDPAVIMLLRQEVNDGLRHEKAKKAQSVFGFENC